MSEEHKSDEEYKPKDKFNKKATDQKEYKWEDDDDSSMDWEPSTEYDPDECSDIEKFEKDGKLPLSLQLPSRGKILKIKKVLLLYNPHAGAKKGKKIAKKATNLLTEGGVHVDIIGLEAPGHAEELCETGDFKEYDVVCILGGDGTFHESINGVMKRREEDRHFPLAMIPAGTGNSFSLEHTGGVKVSRAVKHILRGLCCPMDLAKIEFEQDSEAQTVYSFNSVHWGLASSVLVTAERLRWMGKALRYTTAAFYEFMKGDKEMVKVKFELEDGTEKKYKERFCMIIANNIMSAAKGMKIAPQAKINDGLIDLLLFRSSNYFNLMHAFAESYSGAHTELDHVEYVQVKWFSVLPILEHKGETEELEELIDIDGELKGITPFTCTVIPFAIDVIL